jgi:MerR family transcriptional regulator, light-induced transcriptional regulator
VPGHLRIGELARRTGVNPDVLRAWERRYGVIRPDRTEGGFRLYSDDDERRVRAMVAQLEQGISAAQAARIALAEPTAAAEAEPPLLDALLRFDESGAHAALDRLLADYGREAVLRDAVLPVLRAIGDGWERGEVTVAQEHFASTLLRGRLLGLARGWDRGSGPRALLACAPGERHDLGLIVFGLALREHGWRVTVLGADTPVETMEEASRAVLPDLVVVSASNEGPLLAAAAELGALAATVPLAVGGAGATAAVFAATGATMLPDDPIAAAADVAAGALS